MRRLFRPAAVAIGLFAALGSCNPDRPLAPVGVNYVATPRASIVGPAPVVLVITEFISDPASPVADADGEWFELFNAGLQTVDLQGYTIVSAAGTATESHVITASVLVPSGGYVVLGDNANKAVNGNVTEAYSYGSAITLNNSTTDWLALKAPGGITVDSVSYSQRNTSGAIIGTTGTTYSPTAGASRVLSLGAGQDIGAIDNSFVGGNALWINTPTGVTYTTGNRGTPGTGPYSVTTMSPDAAKVIVSPSTATILEGKTQAFTATTADIGNHPIFGSPMSWTTSDGSVATVDGTGLTTATGPGDATITAAAPSGVFGTATLHVNAFPPTRFSEIHYDNADIDEGEALEIEGPAGTDLTNWSVVLYDGGNGGKAYSTRTFAGTIPPMCNGRGVVVLSYDVNGIQNGNADGFALVNASGQVVEFLSYEGTLTAVDGPAAGRLSADIGAQEASSTPVGSSLQRNGDGVWSGPAEASFGQCNATAIPVPGVNRLTFSGRLATDPALPVGFEDQLFGTERDATTNAVIPTSFTWSTETPSVASIDARGVMHALAEGAAIFRATATDGTTATYTLAMTVPTYSTTAVYAGNIEFGTPLDADASDDQIVVHPQFTASYNKNRNTPNWVSFVLDPSHFGSNVDRCDCFTHDPSLPPDFTHITTADYTGAGVAAGYGIDRGHLARSFDFTAAPGDNANVYWLSNIIPQAADNNQGPWAAEENYLGDLARTQGKEVYVIAGIAGNKGTVKGEGKIVIPANVWKVAVIMPQGKGVADIHDYRDLDVIAVIMPNDPGIRNVDWTTYKTTVDAVEALSGYDLLALLPDDVERAIESNTKPPIVKLDGPYASDEGSPIAMSASGSVDGNGTIASYAWSFGDGTTGAGSGVTHTYAQQGDYTIQLVETDNDGLTESKTTTAHVSNVAPAIGTLADATLVAGETYSASGSFTDPGDDTWSATVDYGDHSGVSPLSLDGTSFTLSHKYTASGVFTVRISISDGDGPSTATTTVHILGRPVANAGGPYVSNEGSLVPMSGAASLDADGTIVSYAWDFGDGATSTGPAVAHTYADNGSFTVTLTVKDNDDLVDVTTTTVSITNLPPKGEFSAPATVNEGDGIALSVRNLSDESSADVAAGFGIAFDCGSGFVAAASLTSTTCATDDNGSRTVRVRITDKDLGSTEYERTVTILNLAPSVSLSATSPVTILSGETVSVAGTFTDHGNDAPWSYAFNWGDLTTTQGTLGASGATANGSQRYLAAGTYSITFRVTDKDGASDARSLFVTVGRRSIDAEVNPQSINLNGNGTGDIKVTLTSAADAAVEGIDVASVRIGSVGVNQKNGKYQGELTPNKLMLHFDRKALIDAGVLTASSTELVLTANLVSGVQIEAHAAVNVH